MSIVSRDKERRLAESLGYLMMSPKRYKERIKQDLQKLNILEVHWQINQAV